MGGIATGRGRGSSPKGFACAAAKLRGRTAIRSAEPVNASETASS